MNSKNGKVFTSKFVGTGPSYYEIKKLPGRGLTKVLKCLKVSLNKNLFFWGIRHTKVSYQLEI